MLGHVYANKALTLTGTQSKALSFFKKGLSYKVLSLDWILRFLAYQAFILITFFHNVFSGWPHDYAVFNRRDYLSLI